MDRWLRSVRGSTFLEVAGVAKEQALNRLTKASIRFWGLEPVDDFTWRLWVLSRDFSQVTKILERSQSTWTVVERTGLLWVLRGFWGRKVFLACFALCLVAAYFSSEYVIFVHVEGNETVSTALILEEIESLGLGLGTKTANIEPHSLKFKMLTKIPELEWLTVTTKGCVATVTVRERSPSQTPVDRKTPTNMVAKEDALVTEVSVLSGIASCAPGDIVAKGEMLISGYGDLETSVVSMASIGEVYGRTWREISMVLPGSMTKKQEPITTKTNYAVIFGRKRINFFENSGEEGAICDKIVSMEPLTLPGGYTLPIYWVTETVTSWETAPVYISALRASSVLTQAGESLIKEQLVAGQMEKNTIYMTEQDGIYRLDGIYQCHEMIGIFVPGLQFEDG